MGRFAPLALRAHPQKVFSELGRRKKRAAFRRALFLVVSLPYSFSISSGTAVNKSATSP